MWFSKIRETLYLSQRRPRQTKQTTSEPTWGCWLDPKAVPGHIAKTFLEKEGVLRKPPGCQSSCLVWGHESGRGSQGTGRTGAWTLGLVGGLHPSWSAFSLVGVSTINHGRETINLPGRTRCSPVACPSLAANTSPGSLLGCALTFVLLQ